MTSQLSQGRPLYDLCQMCRSGTLGFPKEFTPLNDFVFLFNRGLELKWVKRVEGSPHWQRIL